MVHNVDALLLLSIALSSKRRPAEWIEIIAAIDLIQGTIPENSELSAAFHRLAIKDLITEASECFALTPTALTIITAQPKKADHDTRLTAIKNALVSCTIKSELPGILVTIAQLDKARQEYLIAKQHTCKNLLTPKRLPVVDPKRPGRRKPLSARRKF
jgi:hypothetical protein